MDKKADAETKAKAAEAERLEWQKLWAELQATIRWAMILRLIKEARARRAKWESQWLLTSPAHRVLSQHSTARLMTALFGQSAAAPRPAVGNPAPVLRYGFPAPLRSARS